MRALLAAGHKAWLCAPEGGALEDGCAEHKVPFVGGVRMGRGVERVLNFRHDVKRLRALVEEQKIEAVHVHRSDDQLMARMALGKRNRVALIRSWHRDPAGVPAPILKRLARACDASCCVARVHAETLRKAGAARAFYLPPGVDTKRYRPAAEAAEVPDAPVLGLIGRMKAKEDRGHRAFLEMLKGLERKPPWRARLLGRGEGVAAIEKLVAAHPYKERIEIIDSHRDFPAQVAALDLGFVFAVGSDGTSRPAVELLACGVPILAADFPGLRELAEDTACARAFSPKSLHKWSEACGQIMAQPRELMGMKTAARMRAESTHALAVRGASLAGLYHP